MDIAINSQSINDKCVLLSSYEGRDYTVDGENQYLKVKLTSQEKDLINQWTTEAANKITSAFSSLGAKFDHGKITIPIDNNRVEGTNLTTYAEEAIVAYIMANWLKERKPTRYEHYTTLYADMIHIFTKTILQKTEPKLTE